MYTTKYQSLAELKFAARITLMRSINKKASKNDLTEKYNKLLDRYENIIMELSEKPFNIKKSLFWCYDRRASVYKDIYKSGVYTLIPPFTPIGILIYILTALVHAIDILILSVRLHIYRRNSENLVEASHYDLIMKYIKDIESSLRELSLLAKPRQTEKDIIQGESTSIYQCFF